MESRSFFGDAMCCGVPVGWVDADSLRQIPDNQMVFVSNEGEQSLVVEVVEHVTIASESEAAEFFFTDLGSENEAVRAKVLSWARVPLSATPKLAASLPEVESIIPQRLAVYGKQLVQRESDPAPRIVHMYLFVLRLMQHSSEVLVSLNWPELSDDADTSSWGLQPSVASEFSAMGDELKTTPGNDIFREVVRSFDIRDLQLFG